jgi:hypothetical protein
MIRGGRSPRASEAVASALGRPFLLLAVVVLVVNDHWLKAAFPGTFTGKLSDFAGPVVVMSLLAALLGRTTAAVLTAAGFVALKTAPGVAEAAKPLLGGVTRRDPSDLVGLLLLPCVWRALGTSDTRARGTARTSAGREARPQASAPAIVPSPAGPDHRSAAAWIRKVFPPVAGVALSTLALTATSQAAVTEVVSLSVTGTTGFAELTESDRPDEPSHWGISTDGGSTWEEPEEEVPTGLEPAGAEACRSDGRCYAARGGTIDEMVPGGGWTTSFQLSEGKRELLEYRRSDGGADPDEMFGIILAQAEAPRFAP